MDVSTLDGLELDKAVAQVEGLEVKVINSLGEMVLPNGDWWSPTVSWEQGGPIIEREGIAIDCIRCDGKIDGWIATLPMFDEAKYEEPSPTPLIAAMRCYVASKLGDEVGVPEITEEV